MGKAIAYALRHWQALTRFLGDGFLTSTTTSPSERCGTSPWDARTGCSRAVPKAPRRRRRCSASRRVATGTASMFLLICTTSCSGWRTMRTQRLNCCAIGCRIAGSRRWPPTVRDREARSFPAVPPSLPSACKLRPPHDRVIVAGPLPFAHRRRACRSGGPCLRWTDTTFVGPVIFSPFGTENVPVSSSVAFLQSE